MTQADETTAQPLIPLLEPRDGLPEVVATPEALATTVATFAAGTGPVAVDAERASGYRYGQRAYLVQLRREGAGTALVDPVACPDLSGLAAAMADAEWVLHAAVQDLPCLDDVGMRPRRLFDTELAGRMAGHARVALGTLVEDLLGYSLQKAHAAVDWSTRPLPEPWLHYAALDVEVLVELRDALEVRLRRQGKLAWALEEFAAIAATPAPAPRADPWRRTSGMHRVRTRRGLAVVRELWTARDDLARTLDLSPRRVLPDAALVDAALAAPTEASEVLRIPAFRGRPGRNHAARWRDAVARALTLPPAELPDAASPGVGPPPARAWPDRNPAAAARLAAARPAVAAIADEHGLPTENLLAPDAVRRLAWTPPDDLTPEGVAAELGTLGAREWQVALTATVLARALARADLHREVG